MENLEECVLYRDALMLVINKPSGVAVHKGMGKGPNMDALIASLTFGLPNPPQLAHRLDAGTSGCLVLGRHRVALKNLGYLFQNSKIKKVYYAVVLGSPQEDIGTINLPLAKQSQDKRRWWMKVDPDGQPSVTEYRVLARSADFSLLELHPITGRTHQLRVHCQAIGCPILGDAIYGSKEYANLFLHLHAHQVEIPYHKNKPAIDVTAPMPIHMIDTCQKFGLIYE